MGSYNISLLISCSIIPSNIFAIPISPPNPSPPPAISNCFNISAKNASVSEFSSNYSIRAELACVSLFCIRSIVRDRVSLKLTCPGPACPTVPLTPGTEAGAVASDICLTRVSKSVREVDEVSISRISCSMPCCSWRAKSSSVSAGSGGFRGFVVEEGSDVQDEAAGAEDEVSVGGGASVGAAPESKSSRMSNR